MTAAVWWAKRDLRLTDNPALTAAVAGADAVLPVFCDEPTLAAATDTSPMHRHAQWQAVLDLRDRLRRLGADVLLSAREVIDTFEQIRKWYPFTAVHSCEETGNGVTFARDVAVAKWCRERGIEYLEHPQRAVQRAGVNRDRLNDLWRDRVESPPLPAVEQVPQPDEVRRRARMTGLTAMAGHPDWQPVSETDGERTLAEFLGHRGHWYAGGISSPLSAAFHGSRLSAHLAWGTLSVRRVYHATRERLRELAESPEPNARQWGRSLTAFLSRLHWRDHFTQRLETEPAMEFRAIHPAYRDVPYEDDPALLAAWEQGRTGFPLVDAVMRCLAATGFVNFRMRAMAVSFACHALHLDWRAIHPHLARVFRDYEPGIHLSQLQMQAGVVGINTIRVYSPTKQLAEQDAKAVFVKRWVPELRAAAVPAIRDHVASPVPGYVPAVVDFAERTAATKELLYRLRKTQSAADTAEVYRRHGSRKRAAARKEAKPKPPPKRRKERPDQPGLFDGIGVE